MTNDKERTPPGIHLELTEDRNETKERERILAVVTQALPLVNQVSRTVTNKVWRIPSNFVKQLSEDQIIVAGGEAFHEMFPLGESFPGEKKSVLGSYDMDTGRLGINLETLSKASSSLKGYIDDLRLETRINIESLAVFYVLAHEGIIHGRTVKKEITDKKLQYLLREFAKEFIAPEIPEQIPSSDWDEVSIITDGCSVIYRKPSETDIIMIGRGINEAYAQLLTEDLMLSYLIGRYGLNEDSCAKILTPLVLHTTRIDHFANVSLFRKEIGSNQFANLYFSGDFYSDLSSRLGAVEMVELFTKLYEGDSHGFFNEYLKDYGID